MVKKVQQNTTLARRICFFVPAIILAYFAVASRLEISLIAFLALGALYLVLRPFTVSTKLASSVLALYLAVAGFLSFSQPLFEDSGMLFSVIVVLSTALQPVIFLFVLDAISGLLKKTKAASDMAIVVGLWLGTLAAVFGSTSLVRATTNSDPLSTFLVFFVPWLINGFVFFVASFAIVIIRFVQKKRR